MQVFPTPTGAGLPGGAFLPVRPEWFARGFGLGLFCGEHP